MLDSFRMEAVTEGSNIHAATIYPGAVKTELLNSVAPSETKTMVEKFCEQAGMTPDVIANAVLYALSRPDNVNVSDLVIRPGMGQSGTLLAEMSGTGDWQEGQRFSGGAGDSDVTDWVNSLGLNG